MARGSKKGRLRAALSRFSRLALSAQQLVVEPFKAKQGARCASVSGMPAVFRDLEHTLKRFGGRKVQERGHLDAPVFAERPYGVVRLDQPTQKVAPIVPDLVTAHGNDFFPMPGKFYQK